MRANLLSLLAGTTVFISTVCPSHARRSQASVPTRCHDLRDESACERLIAEYGCDSEHVVNVCARMCHACTDVCAEDYDGCHPACAEKGRNAKCCDALYTEVCSEVRSRGYCKEQHPKRWVGLALCQETCKLCNIATEKSWKPPAKFAYDPRFSTSFVDDSPSAPAKIAYAKYIEQKGWEPPVKSADEPRAFWKSSNGLVMDEIYPDSDVRYLPSSEHRQGGRKHNQKNAQTWNNDDGKSAYEDVEQKGSRSHSKIEAKVMLPQAKILQPDQKFGVAELSEAKILQPDQKFGVAELPEAKILQPDQKFGVAQLPEAKILQPDQKFGVVELSEAKILQPDQKFGVAQLPEAKILQPAQKFGVAELPEAKILQPDQKFGVAALPEAKILQPDQKFSVASPRVLEGKDTPAATSQPSVPVAADNTSNAINNQLPWYTWVIVGFGVFILVGIPMCCCLRSITNRRREKLQRMSDRYYGIDEANPKSSLLAKSSLSMKAQAADNNNSFSDGPLARSLSKDRRDADYNTVLFDRNASPHQF